MGWRGRKRWSVGLVLGLGAWLLLSGTAEANVLCQILPMPCTYEGAAFRFTVVDAETRQPIGDFHALAEWIMYGLPGQYPPLMVLEAVSGPDGQLTFPAWGPIRGPRTGLMLASDPVVTLFKSGYNTARLVNPPPPGTTETTRVRGFGRDGQTIALEPFRGTPDEWVDQLDRVWGGLAMRGEDTTRKFRDPYLNRVRRVWAERDKVPERHRIRPGFFWFVEQEMKRLEGIQQ